MTAPRKPLAPLVPAGPTETISWLAAAIVRYELAVEADWRDEEPTKNERGER